MSQTILPPPRPLTRMSAAPLQAGGLTTWPSRVQGPRQLAAWAGWHAYPNPAQAAASDVAASWRRAGRDAYLRGQQRVHLRRQRRLRAHHRDAELAAVLRDAVATGERGWRWGRVGGLKLVRVNPARQIVKLHVHG